MDEIRSLLGIDFKSFIISLFVILIAIKTISELVSWFIQKLGLETKASRKKREEHELVVNTAKELEELQKIIGSQERDDRISKVERQNEQQSHDISSVVSSVDKIQQSVDNLTDMVNVLRVDMTDKTIEDYRQCILDFGSAISEGSRRFSKEKFEHVISIYEKYEKILKDNNLSNGQVTASMEVIMEVYKEKLKNGF